MPPAPRYGYSCRPRIKGYIEGQCFDAVRLWFTVQQDAAGNVDSSNPQKLYERLEQLANQNDQGDRYIRDLRGDLYVAVLKSGCLPAVRRKLRQQIRCASGDNFRPERLRLDLCWIARSRGCTVAQLLNDCRHRAAMKVRPPQQLQPDEYLITDLPLRDIASWCRFL